MAKNLFKARILKTNWYYQGGAAKPWYHSYPWSACFDMRLLGKKIPVKYDALVYMRKAFFDVYISKKSLTAVASYHFKKQQADPAFIYRLNRNWKKLVTKFLDINDRVLKRDLSKLDDKQFLASFDEFAAAYIKEWQEVIFLDGFDYYGERILNQALGKAPNLTADEITILINPPRPSFLQQERLELLRLAERVKKQKIKLTKAIPGALLPDLEAISRKYNWLSNDYAIVEHLGPKYFYKKLRSLAVNRKALAEEREMKRFLANLQKQKRKITARKKMPVKVANTIDFLAMLGNMRDERKTYNQVAGSAIKKFGQEAARRSGIPFIEVEFLFYYELPKLFTPARKQIRKILKKRKNQTFYIPQGPLKNQEIYGAESARLGRLMKATIFSKKESLSGQPAYVGQVKGRVKIVKDQNDFIKMKRGDILVAPNTRPEYVPVMKLAGAIVTDEGGITSHAAIVSRELKVPCVVGVQGATTILRDGDLVEVDAEKGVVKILK